MFSVTFFLFKLSLLFLSFHLSCTLLHMSWFVSQKHTHREHMSSVLTPPYVRLGVVADAKTRGTSQYQQSTACLLPLTHHHLTVLIIYHTRSDKKKKQALKLFFILIVLVEFFKYQDFWLFVCVCLFYII